MSRAWLLHYAFCALSLLGGVTFGASVALIAMPPDEPVTLAAIEPARASVTSSDAYWYAIRYESSAAQVPHVPEPDTSVTIPVESLPVALPVMAPPPTPTLSATPKPPPPPPNGEPPALATSDDKPGQDGF